MDDTPLDLERHRPVDEGYQTGHGCRRGRCPSTGRDPRRKSRRIQLVVGHKNKRPAQGMLFALEDFPGPAKTLMKMQPRPETGDRIDALIEG